MFVVMMFPMLVGVAVGVSVSFADDEIVKSAYDVLALKAEVFQVLFCWLIMWDKHVVVRNFQ